MRSKNAGIKLFLSASLSLFAASAFCADYEAGMYDSYMATSNSSFYNSSYIAFTAGWSSTNDFIDTPELSLKSGSSQTAEQSIYDISGATFSNLKYLSVSVGAAVTISDSVVEIGSFVDVGDVKNGYASSLLFKNCDTVITANETNRVDGGASMLVEGGTFKMLEGDSDMQTFVIGQGSSLTFKDAEVDVSGVELATRTDNSYSGVSATINIENCTFTSGYIDTYSYELKGALSTLNITKGSKATLALAKTHLAYDWGTGQYYETVQYMRGGIVNVSGEGTVLNLTSDMIQADDLDDQVYTSKLNVLDGASASVDGDVNISAVKLDGGSLSADNIEVGSGRTLEVLGNSVLTADTLIVMDGSQVVFGDGITLDIETLDVMIEDLKSGMNYDIRAIFGERFGDILLAVGDNVFMSDFEGNTYLAEVSGSILTAGAAVPEPAACAAIFGALTLAFAAYRRRS